MWQFIGVLILVVILLAGAFGLMVMGSTCGHNAALNNAVKHGKFYYKDKFYEVKKAK